MPTRPTETLLGRSADDLSRSSGGGVPARAVSTSERPSIDLPQEPRLPGITLPRGGGAITGIGEAFKANPATGTASFSLPIAATPGRGGFGPRLTLAYDSGAGNGPFGLGFGLDVPSIGRKTDRRLPTYDDVHDQFALTGAEELVPGLRRDGDHWVADTALVSGWQVARFRPRVDTAWAVIERWRDPMTGETHWRTITRDNVTSIFGRTAASRIADPDAPGRVFRWLLDEVRDDRGEVARYTYVAEDGAGTPGRPGAYPERYLKRIEYGNAQPGVADEFRFEVVFDHGEHPGDVPDAMPSEVWPVRVDPFTSHRAGFALRTLRRCRRVLCFHRFPELGAQPVLVRSTSFSYDERPTGSRLVAAVVTGHRPDVMPAAMPAIEFEWSDAAHDDTVRTLDADVLADAPVGVDERSYRLVDLDGEGMPGILHEHAGAFLYKRNLGGGRFGPAETIGSQPAGLSLASGGQLADLAGDGGLCLVRFDAEPAGFHERTSTGAGAPGEWGPFVTFASRPRINWQDPNLRFLDLDGDGRADLLVAGDDCLCWYPSHGRAGFGSAEQVRRATDEAQGPTCLFSDGVESLFLADMDGDGLVDLVRIRNGEVCYWPNLGYGRFGARVVMADAPRFEADDDEFDPRRIRLADVDGTGPVDVLYLRRDGVHLHVNTSGNGFIAPRVLPVAPAADHETTVIVADLLGAGMACLVWSSPAPAAAAPLHYIDLAGGVKSDLLVCTRNNLGAETRIRYAPSTRDYRADVAAGRPWAARLPFPVHVVAEVEVLDLITGSRLVTRYAYHHGCYDGVEREFRGFGAVDQWDAEELPAAGDRTYERPPVRTTTWFHTGVFVDADVYSRQYAREYWNGDPEAPALPDSRVPPDLDAEGSREAMRALKGRPLRVEVYAEDGTSRAQHPYTVVETRYEVRREQPALAGAPAVFAVFDRETRSAVYERDPADPRVSQQLTLAVDEWGVALRTASVALPRRRAMVASDPRLDPSAEQASAWIVVTEAAVKHLPAALGATAHRLAIPTEVRLWALTGVPTAGPWGPDELDLAFLAAAPSAAEVTPSGAAERRLAAAARTFYCADDTGAGERAPLGVATARALVHTTCRLALTPGFLSEVLGGRANADLLADGGYVALDDDGLWWAPSSRPIYAPDRFFQAKAMIDPWGAATTIHHDVHALLPVRVEDPLGNVIRAEIDYLAMQPVRTIDANGNGAAAAADPLGRVVRTAVFGKLVGEGDSLEDPTTRLEIDLHAWRTRGEPAVITSYTRETHGDPATRWLVRRVYSDGFGREVLTKDLVAPGPAPTWDGAQIVWRDAAERWVGSGRIVYDNKGSVVRQYEPFFAPTRGYETEDALVRWGVTPVFAYDPLGRNIRVDLPNGTFREVRFDAWAQEAWDEGDTVERSAWYAARVADPGPEGRAARASLPFAGTPSVTHLDAMARPVLVIADNATQGRYGTRSTLDALGQTVAVTDALGRVCLRERHDAGGQMLHTRSIDAGEKWSLTAVDGQPLATWDTRGHATRLRYDAVRRPIALELRQHAGPVQVVERREYGEAAPDAVARNLRGGPWRNFDGAGLATVERCDFAARPVEQSRRLARDATVLPDWSTPAETLLEPETFTVQTRHDALGRATWSRAPDGSITENRFDAGGRLTAVAVTPAATGQRIESVREISYDAPGQREAIHLGNGVMTTYQWDPQTFRLARQTTTRPGGTLQGLVYTYDAAGNITERVDAAAPPAFYNNADVSPRAVYTYDALHRLVRATGREHIGQNPGTDQHYAPDPNPSDVQALRPYEQSYTYDAVGNILRMAHRASGGDWTRDYTYVPGSNRLASTGNDRQGVVAYTHDDAGNMTSMAHLPAMRWDFRDRLLCAERPGTGPVWFTYDADGQRVRKLAQTGGVSDERIYLGSYEVYRRHKQGAVETEWQTLHVMDGERRVALVEVKTVADVKTVTDPDIIWRYQHDDPLHATSAETNEDGHVISRDEHHPYGTSAISCLNAVGEVSQKRYRYNRAERDEETGLACHGRRFYIAWLGRWLSTDPAGFVDGFNLFIFGSANPVRHHDPTGLASWEMFEDDLGAYSPRTSQFINMRDLKDLARAALFDSFGGSSSALPPFITRQEPAMLARLAASKSPLPIVAHAELQAYRNGVTSEAEVSALKVPKAARVPVYARNRLGGGAPFSHNDIGTGKPSDPLSVFVKYSHDCVAATRASFKKQGRRLPGRGDAVPSLSIVKKDRKDEAISLPPSGNAEMLDYMDRSLEGGDIVAVQVNYSKGVPRYSDGTPKNPDGISDHMFYVFGRDYYSDGTVGYLFADNAFREGDAIGVFNVNPDDGSIFRLGWYGYNDPEGGVQDDYTVTSVR
jgi:RHS repeat-associated protein